MRDYSLHNMGVGKSVEEMVKSISAFFVCMAMCMSRAIPKWDLREISELYYFSENLRQNWTGYSKQSLENGIEIGGKECVVSIDPFSLESLGTYTR